MNFFSILVSIKIPENTKINLPFANISIDLKNIDC